jgi:prepilin peptidase CpaA
MFQVATVLAICAFPALMAAAAFCDVTSMTIPNTISIALVAVFFVASALARLPLQDFSLHVGVGLAAFVLMIITFAMGWLGGGDAKLLAAAALWMGPHAAAPFVMWTAFAGGGLALFFLLARQVPMPVLAARGPAWVQRLLEPKGAIPYGVAIAAGAIAAFPSAGFGTGLFGVM